MKTTVLAALVLCLAASACAPRAEKTGEAERPVAPIKSYQVKQTAMIERLAAPATVIALADRTTTIMPSVAARLVSLHASVGQAVRAGDAVATLVSDPTVRAELSKAGVARKLAQAELARQLRLNRGGVTPRVNVDLARAADANALADLEARQEVYRQAQANAVLRTPIGGVVTHVGGSVGGLADLSKPLVTVVDLRRVGLEVQVTSAVLERLKVGLPVTIHTPAGKRLPGRILRLERIVDPATQRGRFLVEAENPGMRLQPGMYTTVEATLGSHPGLHVPLGAIAPRKDGNVVYVITRGVAHARKVVLGPRSEKGHVEVLSGLQAGDWVATEGAYVLSDGAAVSTGK